MAINHYARLYELTNYRAEVVKPTEGHLVFHLTVDGSDISAANKLDIVRTSMTDDPQATSIVRCEEKPKAL